MTPRGWAVLAGSLVLAGGGRVLGLGELAVLAAGSVSLVVAAALWVRRPQPNLTVTRQVLPSHPSVGDAITVALEVANAGRRTHPAMELQDLADGALASSTWLGALSGGCARSVTYRLGCPARGRRVLGPVVGVQQDPFGLARRSIELGASTTLLIRPVIDHLRTPPGLGAAAGTRARPAGLTRPGGSEEFAGLRAFVPGDDVRRVHWPTSARQGRLLIRQMEDPGRGRTTLVLDCSAAAGRHFEAAVRATASLAWAAVRAGQAVRLVSGPVLWTSGWGTNPTHLDQILDHLAEVRGNPTADPAQDPSHLDLLGTPGDKPGAVVVLSARPGSTAAADGQQRLRIQFGPAPLTSTPESTARRGEVLWVNGPEDFAAQWTTLQR